MDASTASTDPSQSGGVSEDISGHEAGSEGGSDASEFESPEGEDDADEEEDRSDRDDEDDDDGPGPDLYPQHPAPSISPRTLGLASASVPAPAGEAEAPRNLSVRLPPPIIQTPPSLPPSASTSRPPAPTSASLFFPRQERPADLPFGAASSLGIPRRPDLPGHSLQNPMSCSYRQGMVQMLRVMTALEEEQGEGMALSGGESGTEAEGALGKGKGKIRRRRRTSSAERERQKQRRAMQGRSAETSEDEQGLLSRRSSEDVGQPAGGLHPELETEILSDVSDGGPHEPHHLASSLHAIHRPHEMQQRRTEESLRRAALAASIAAYRSPLPPDETPSPPSGSGRTSPRPTSSPLAEEVLPEEEAAPPATTLELESSPSSAATPATAAALRRQQLSTKLQDIFSLATPEDLISEFPCHLYLSIPLSGHLYVTTGHLCFYAFLRRRSGQVVRSGTLGRRVGGVTGVGLVSTITGDAVSATGTVLASTVGMPARHVGVGRRYAHSWFVLKDSVLAWFPSSTEPYFPLGSIDLHYVTAVTASTHHGRHFTVTVSVPVVTSATGTTSGSRPASQGQAPATGLKRHHFSTDSPASRDDWVKVLKKEVLGAQNDGGSIKVAIPLETVEEVVGEEGVEFAKMVVVRTHDVAVDDSLGGVDDLAGSEDYLFSFSRDVEGPLKTMNQALDEFRSHLPPSAGPTTAHDESHDHTVRDTTRATPLLQAERMQRTASGSHPGRPGSGTQSPRTDTNSPVLEGFMPQRSLSRFLPGRRSPRVSDAAAHPPTAATVAHPVSPTPVVAPNPVAASLLEDAVSDPPATASAEAVDDGSGFSQLTRTNSGETIRDATGLSDTIVHLAPAHTYPPGTFPPTTAAAAASAAGGWTTLPGWIKHAPSLSSAKGLITAPVGVATALVGRTRAPTQSRVSVTMPSGGGTSSGSASRAPAPRNRRLSMWTGLGLGNVSAEPEDMQHDDAAHGEHEEDEHEVDAVDELAEAKFRHAFSQPIEERLITKCGCYLFRGLPVYGRLHLSSRHLCFRGRRPMNGTKMILPLNDVIAANEQKGFRFGYSGLVITVRGYEEIFLEFSTHESRARLVSRLRSQLEVLQQSRTRDPSPSKDEREAIVLKDLEADGESEGDSSDTPALMFQSTSSSFVTFKPPEPMHITCLTVGSRGDVQPYIALCKGLLKDGHRCRIASHPEYRKWVEGYGIEFAEVGGDPAELMRICVDNGMFTVSFLREGIAKFRGWLDELLLTSWRACRGTDLLIESPSTMAGIHIAEALQIPYYRAFTMPWTRTRAYPHAFAVPEHKMGGGYNYMTYTMFDAVFWRAISGQINRWRRKQLGLHSTSYEKMQSYRIPFLYNFSRALVPPPLDWYEWIHVTGYWFLDGNDDAGQSWEPPPELVQFLDRAEAQGKKVVYIGFGSIVVSDPEQVSRMVVEAVQKSGVYAIVSKGWSDRLAVAPPASATASAGTPQTSRPASPHVDAMEEAERSLDCIFNVKSVPHDWLFPRIHAACHHGGAGTTGASLRAGIPTIIRPFFGDQYFWADRVEHLGIGTCLKKLTVKALSSAIITATTHEKQIAKAKVIGEEIRAENGVATAIECLYRDLEYAKTLIKRGTRIESLPSQRTNSRSVPMTPTKSPLLPGQSGSSKGQLSDGEDSSWDVLSQARSERTDLASSFDRLSEPPSARGRRVSRPGSDIEDDDTASSPRQPRRQSAGDVLNRFSSPARRGPRTTFDIPSDAARTSHATFKSGSPVLVPARPRSASNGKLDRI